MVDRSLHGKRGQEVTSHQHVTLCGDPCVSRQCRGRKCRRRSRFTPPRRYRQRRPVRGSRPPNEPCMRVITVSAGPERFPVRNEINIRCPCRRTGEGDKRPLSVQQHVIEQVRSGPAKTAGWAHQFGLGQPFHIRGHGPVRNCHGQASTVSVDVRHRATIDDTRPSQTAAMREEMWLASPEPAVGVFTPAGTCPGRLRHHCVIGYANSGQNPSAVRSGSYRVGGRVGQGPSAVTSP